MIQDSFYNRHMGPRSKDIDSMLETIGVSSLDELIKQTLPNNIMFDKPLDLPEGMSEAEYLAYMRSLALKNKNYKSYIGLGYYNTYLPSVILRNILENPSWYTSYTPYQAEISQGRLEALLNFQTVILSLTGMPITNCSLLDEGTATGEAANVMFSKRNRAFVKSGGNQLFVDEKIFPQTLAVLQTRTAPLGIEIVQGDYKTFNFTDQTFAAIVQYPNADGSIENYKEFVEKAHANNSMVTVVADIMSLAVLEEPGQWGVDIVCGSTQRFGIPMGYGGPHAAYMATTEALKRNIPGRIIGITVDRNGNKALRMALQTREQHIKREKATSNICTAQALIATMAGMYAVYHGSEGIKNIAEHIHTMAGLLNSKLAELGFTQHNKNFFDTLKITVDNADQIMQLAVENQMNFRKIDDKTIGISTDETTSVADLNNIVKVFEKISNKQVSPIECNGKNSIYFDKSCERKTPILEEKIFNSYRSETEMMRYIKKLERKDISLTHSMISLGSCTMKLNSATSMFALSWSEMGNVHPFVPKDQAQGYQELIADVESDLSKITGFAGTSLQPNSGASGEYAGLMVISAYHRSNNQQHRNIILIPASAHGTNPASAAMAGGKVIVVECDEKGNICVDDLKAKAEEHKDNLHSFMITYPSTHGVFESKIKEMIDIIHTNGGQVYMDGANMNGQVGLTSPGFIGADVCHLNLHKTFSMPHGGGGPGVGSISVASHLVEFLPGNPVVESGGSNAITAVSSAPYGSAFVLPITHAYIKMLGCKGLTDATKIAILNANYIVKKLENHYNTLYTGETGRVAHELIVDCRNFRHDYGIETLDIAKRLMDYGFHAPTMSFPVHETLMVEPTESESKEEIDRFIETMISILEEIKDVKSGKADANDNVLKNAPHTVDEVTADEWNHPYSRQQAAFPLKWIGFNKFWPSSARVDDGYGDRNLVCSCAPIEDYL